MQWLLAHMWTALAATGALGLLFGWAFRGLGLRGKLRRAEGERNIALGTLQEKETELEALYAAGRAPSASEAILEGDEALRKELDEREVKLQTLTDELARSKAALTELRDASDSSNSVGAVTGVIAGAAAAKALTGGQDNEDFAPRLDADLNQDDASLEWRNRYLESQVRSLQTKVQELSDGAPALPASSLPTVGDADVSEGEDVAMAKLKWQNDYLRQRLAYSDQYGGVQDVSIDESTEFVDSETELTTQAVETSDGGTSDEEIAKLRWRNRYLEGRLAYYEGDKADGDDSEDKSGILGLAASAATAATVIADDVVDRNEDDEEEESTAQLVEDDQTDQENSEDAAAAIGEQPLALDGPVGGEGDDLTAIGGIGPKIEKVLNELGVYHFDQIASWTQDNIDWVDEYLAFKGRIEREQWVQQAAALSGDGSS